jgi:hypothetical protein
METEREHDDTEPGPLVNEKLGETSDPPHPQPEAAEVESARLLANQSRETLEGHGLQWDEILRLADEFIALDRGTELDTFVEWASTEGGRDRGTG